MAEDWRWWLKGLGVRAPKSLKTLGFDSYANVIQAALDGQGVALGFSGLALELIASGRLIRPINAEMTRGLAVYVVTPNRVKPSPAVRSFVKWIIAEGAKSTRAIATIPAGTPGPSTGAPPP
jgi:LysR family glycine cleavage system transcriptional activator